VNVLSVVPTLPSVFTVTVVLDGSSLVNFTGASASTPVAPASGEVTATLLCGGAGEAAVPSPFCAPSSQLGDLSPLQPAPSSTAPAASTTIAYRKRPRPARPVGRVAPVSRTSLVTFVSSPGLFTGTHPPS
jgi:hypothetical protein